MLNQLNHRSSPLGSFPFCKMGKLSPKAFYMSKVKWEDLHSIGWRNMIKKLKVKPECLIPNFIRKHDRYSLISKWVSLNGCQTSIFLQTPVFP